MFIFMNFQVKVPTKVLFPTLLYETSINESEYFKLK
jgi:hypothetical protein